MVATIRATSPVSVLGDATGSSVTRSITPTLPTGSLAGDRIFLCGCATTTMSLSANGTGWNVLLANTSLGGGSVGASTGPRTQAIWWRDYDGTAWTMPTIQSAAMAQPSLSGFTMAVAPGPFDLLAAPTVITGSMTTAALALSVASPAAVWSTGMLLMMVEGFPSTVTVTAGSVTASGVTFGTKTNDVVSAGTTTGNDVATGEWSAPVTVGSGSSVAATHTATLAVSRTAGVAFIGQTVTPTKSPPPPNPWKRRQPLLVR